MSITQHGMGGGFDAYLTYTAATGRRTTRSVTVSVLYGRADGAQLTPSHFKAYCHLRGALREFHLDRIVELVDPSTGEVIADHGAWLTQMATARRRRVPPRPVATQRVRRILPDIRFTEGLAAGWAFGVPEAFKHSLDIYPTAKILSGNSPLRRQLKMAGIIFKEEAVLGDRALLDRAIIEMRDAGISVYGYDIKRDRQRRAVVEVRLDTQGSPANFDFSAGDIFYDPPAVRNLVWHEAKKILARSVKVVEAEAGYMDIELCGFSNGATVSSRRIDLHQDDFVELLKSGSEPILPNYGAHALGSEVGAGTPALE